MPYIRLSDGTVAHVKVSKTKQRCAVTTQSDRCRRGADFLCDYKLPSGATCDVHLCACHATVMGKARHYCPPHAARDAIEQHRKLFTSLGLTA